MKKTFFLLIALFLTTIAFSQTKTEIRTGEIPKNVAAYLSRHFSAFHIDKAFKTDNKGVVSTEVIISRKQEKLAFTFDKDARLIKKEAIRTEVSGTPPAKPKPASVPSKKTGSPDPEKK